MKNLLLTFSLFCTFSLPAQNAWDLFPLNQKTWWRAGDTLRLHYNDSTEIFGQDRFHYFGSKYVMEVFDDCFYSLLGEIPAWVPFFPPPDFFYTWNSKNDVWKLNGDDLPIFYPKSLPGESWTFPVKNGNGYNKIRIDVRGMDGRLGLENNRYQRGQPVDISGLPAGVYLLTIRSNNAVATGKVVKM